MLTRIDGRRLASNSLGRVVRALVDRAGVEAKLPSHAFWGTVATVMYEQGVRTRVIERIMGWSPRQMHERHYLRVADAPSPTSWPSGSPSGLSRSTRLPRSSPRARSSCRSAWLAHPTFVKRDSSGSAAAAAAISPSGPRRSCAPTSARDRRRHRTSLRGRRLPTLRRIMAHRPIGARSARQRLGRRWLTADGAVTLSA